jgi:hypothetical protein
MKRNRSLELINQIEKIRSKNNKNWMDLLRLSFKLDAKNSSKILSKITNHDKKISAITKKLQQLNK